MAKNVRNAITDVISLELAVAAGSVSGETVVVGTSLIGHCETDRNSDGNATVMLPGLTVVVEQSCVAVNNAGNSAIVLGDKAYIDGATVYNKDVTNGVFCGYFLDAVASGATATGRIALFQEGA